MQKKRYTRLEHQKRESLSRGLAQHTTIRQIAKELGRSPSIISRKIRRNKGKSGYRAFSASESLQTDNGSTLVFYSLGNALFDSYGLADTSHSAIILVMLDAQGIEDVEAFPFVIDAINSFVVPADLSTEQKILQRLSLP
jgi:DNA-binding MurR/RpiR family transcriptional regulator